MASAKKPEAVSTHLGGAVSPQALEAIIDTATCLNGWLDHIDFPTDDYGTHVTKLLLCLEIAFRQIGFDGESFTALCDKIQKEMQEVSPDKNQLTLNLGEAA